MTSNACLLPDLEDSVNLMLLILNLPNLAQCFISIPPENIGKT